MKITKNYYQKKQKINTVNNLKNKKIKGENMEEKDVICLKKRNKD